MATIVRHQPGDLAPWTGTYVLVGHYGEATDVAVWCARGDRLPLVTIAAAFGPLWFVHVDVADERPRAA
jgi:hypothetical protein